MTKPDKPPNPNRDISNAETREWRAAMLAALAAIKDALAQTSDLAAITARINDQVHELRTAVSDHAAIPGATSPLTSTEKGRSAMDPIYDQLSASVSELEEVDTSVMQLLDNISAALAAALALNDPAVIPAVQAVIDRINTQKAALAQAVVDHTPAA